VLSGIAGGLIAMSVF